MNSNKQTISDSEDENVPLAKRTKTNRKISGKRFSIESDSSCSPSTSKIRRSFAKSKKMYSHQSDSEDDNLPLQRIKLESNGSTNTKRLDKFCWNCHKKSAYEVKCSKCVLTFHMNCINLYKIGWTCPKCQLAEKPDDWILGNNSIGDLLKRVFEVIVQEIDSIDIPEDYICSNLLVNVVTFDDIRKKIERAEYTSTHAFLFDIELLRHNCKILHKYGDGMWNNSSDVCDSANNLVTKCMEELYELKQCGDCYMNDVNGHHALRVCSRPHLVVWAKYTKYYPYWPAKLLQVGEGKQPLEVYFFGDNELGNVTYANCYLYSKEDPNEDTADQYKDSLKKAIDEAAKYIAKVEETFGEFRYAAVRTKLIRGNVDTEQYDEMIPGYRNPMLRTHRFENQSPENSSHNDNNDIRDMTNNFSTNQPANNSDLACDCKQPCIPITKPILKQMEGLRNFLRELKIEQASNRAQIAKLQEENETLKKNKLIDNQVNDRLKVQLRAEFDEQAIELIRLRTENIVLKQEKEVESSVRANLNAEIAQLYDRNQALEKKLKTQCDTDFDKQTQLKLSQWCSVCLDKIQVQNTALCASCKGQ